MIVLTNGPFGSGKSTSADLVAERLQAHVLDPEVIGLALWGLGTRREGEDYRYDNVWRDLLIAATESIHRNVAKDIVVPMNLLRIDVFEHLVARWGEIDRVVPVRLVIDEATLRARIADRGESEEWCLSHAEADAVAVANPRFGVAIDSTMPPRDVAEAIIAAAT